MLGEQWNDQEFKTERINKEKNNYFGFISIFPEKKLQPKT